MVVYAGDLSTSEVEAEDQKFRSHPWLYSELEASLSHRSHWLKTKAKRGSGKVAQKTKVLARNSFLQISLVDSCTH